jgi:hypothetical protein
MEANVRHRRAGHPSIAIADQLTGRARNSTSMPRMQLRNALLGWTELKVKPNTTLPTMFEHTIDRRKPVRRV